MMCTAEQFSDNWHSFDYKSQSANVLFTFTKAWSPVVYFRFGSKIGLVEKIIYIFYVILESLNTFFRNYATSFVLTEKAALVSKLKM